MIFKALKSNSSINKFEESCSLIEKREIIIPEDILLRYADSVSLKYFNSKEVDDILIETLNYHHFKFDSLIKQIDSYEFFDVFFTFSKHYIQIRNKNGFLNQFESQRIRFIGGIIEEGPKLKLKTKKCKKWDYKLIQSLYKCFIDISFISNKISTSIILNIQSVNIKFEKSKVILNDSEVNSHNLKIAFDFLNQRSVERYISKDYSKIFFKNLSKIGLSEKELYNKLNLLFNKSKKGKLPLSVFEKVLSDLGVEFQNLMLGLVLKKENINSIINRVRKPYIYNRYLTFPFPILEIDNEQFVMIDKVAFTHGFQYSIGDLLNYGKIPIEWKELFTDKVLGNFKQGDDFEDKIEKLLIEKNIPYVREMKISNREPDFLIYIEEQNLLIIVECKNLMKRSDPNSWLNDYRKFCSNSGEKSFNQKMNNMLSIVKEDHQQVIERFKKKHNKDIKGFELKSLFIINSPTLYMFASDHLIVTWKMFNEMLNVKNFNGEMIFENNEYLVNQNIRFFRHDQYPKEFISKKTGGGIFILNQ